MRTQFDWEYYLLLACSLALEMPVTPPPLPASATIASVEREAA